MSENFERDFRPKAASPESASETFERYEDVGFEPGDKLITDEGSFRASSIVFNPKHKAGGYADFNKVSNDGKQSVVRLGFKDVAELKIRASQIDKLQNEEGDPLSEKINGIDVDAKRVRDKFAQLNIRPGDTLVSTKGTTRLVKQVEYNWSPGGGRIISDRTRQSSGTKEEDLFLDQIADDQRWIKSVQRNRES